MKEQYHNRYRDQVRAEEKPVQPEKILKRVSGCKALNVRDGASYTAKVLCAVPEGTEVKILTEGKTFSEVVTPVGIQGFAMNDYLK